MADFDEEIKTEVVVPKKSRKKLYIIVAVVLLLLVSAAVWFFLLKKGSKTAKEELGSDAAQEEGAVAEGAEEESELEEGEEALGTIYPLESFVVNLEGGRYIRLQLQLEFAERDISKRFFIRLVPIRDAIITLLTKKTSEEILSEKGKEKLRSEVKDIVNEMLKKEEVKRIYFTNYVVQ